MKNLNLIERLLSDSHEKQKPQRLRRYAVMLMMLLTLGVGQMWATKTIYYANPNDWNPPYCYAWGTGNNGWPGKAMTATDHKKDGHTIYKIDLSDSYTKCIFSNNGANQTGDLTFTANKVYNGSNWNNSFDASYWDAEYGSRNIYLDISNNTGWINDSHKVGFHTYYSPVGASEDHKARNQATLVEGNIYVVTASTINSAYVRSFKAARWSGDNNDSNTSNQINANTSKNKLSIPSNGWSNCNLTWGVYVPTVSSVALSYSVVPTSGSGTESDPYIVATGTSVTVTATPTSVIDDSQCTMKYKWDSDSYGKTNTKTLNCSTNNTTYSTTVTCKNYISSDGGNTASATVYFKAVSTPTIGLSAPLTGVRGNSITLTATTTNASTPTIVYEYSTSSTFASSVTTIASTTSTTQSWTIPSGISATTYYLRAKMTISSTTYYSSILTLTAYGKKTIKVKDTNNWGDNFKIHRWGGDAEGTTWPGETTNITSAGGQWKQVVLYSSSTDFLFDNSSDPDHNKTANKTYAGMTDGNCYEIQSGTGGSLTLTSTDCPDKPDVTTAAAGSFTNSKATLNASGVDANNDAITAYGFKWGTTTACANTQAASNLSSTTFSYQLTGLTAGQTYFFKAYATNGQGTTEGSILSFVVPYKVTVTKPTGCSEITNSGTNYTSSSITIVATKATGYTFSSWSTTNGTQTSTSSEGNTNTLVFTPTSDNATIQPVYTENDYIVTVTAGDGGTVASGSVTGHKDTKVTLPTATPYPGYRFTGWTTTTGSLTYTNQSSASTAQVNGLTAAATVQANFTRTYAYLEGRMTVCNSSRGSETNIGASKGVWADGSTNVPMTYDETNHRFYRHTYKRPDELKAQQSSQNQWFYVKVSQADGSLSNPTAYHPSGSNGEFSAAGYANKIAAPTTTATYNFRINASTNDGYAIIYFDESYVWYELEHSFKYNGNGNTSGNVPASRTYYDNGATVTVLGNVDASPLVKTGYTFNNWKTGESSGTSYSAGNTFSITTNTTLYAQWTPKSCTVNFNFNESDEGWGSSTGATNSTTATYDSDMPTVTPPTAKNGYAFMGYWDNSTGSGGNQYYKADGTSNKQWDKDRTEAITLYARYKKAEITEITLNATAFEPVKAGDEGYVVANPTIDPTPVAPTEICWELLYDNDNPVPSGHDASPYTEGGAKPYQVRFSIDGLAAGSYKVRATLHTGSGACGTGTTLSVEEASFTIASDFTVTVLYKCGDVTIKSSTTNPGKALVGTSITAPDIIGYTFSKWKAGDGVTIDGADGNGEKATATITYTANYNGTLTAIYTKKNVIYFYNTVGWTDVWVYFYTSDKYWADDYGTGAYKGKEFEYNKQFWDMHYGQMTQIEGTNIWYFDYTAKGWDGWPNIAFANMNKANSGEDNTSDNDKAFFSNTISNPIQVIRRGDHKTTLPMFVPLTGQTKQKKNNNKAEYLSDGYWMNYPDNTGYTLKIYSSQDATTPIKTIRFPFSENLTMPLKLNVEFNSAAALYYYTIYREDGTVLSADYGMNKNHHTNVRLNYPSKKISLKTTAPGIYKYSLVYMNNSGTKDYYISVDYPIVENDYRISYSDNATWSQGSAHASGWYHPSDVIRKNTDAEITQYDTVSFFISKGAGITAYMKFQYASKIVEAGTITWTDVPSGSITIPSSITESGVYNFIIKQVGTAKPEVEKVEPYTGNYYIRTDNAGNTKWDYFRSRDHQMVYTEFSSNRETNTFGELYTHYFTSWCERGTNIKFCIANDYSSCISDTLAQDVGNPFGNTNTGGTLNSDGATLPINDKYSANVRFMYNETTNKICRAYIGSSTNPARKFLMLEGNQVLKGDDDEAISDWVPRYALILADKQNWIYEHTLKIKPKTRFKLYACYAQTTVSPDGAQYFRGAYESGAWAVDNTKSVILIDGSGGYQMARIIYDFKTNRLMTAWIPSGSNVSGNMEINADVLVEREHQEPAQYITFANASSQLSGVKTVYGAMKFNRWILNNRDRSSDVDPNHGKTAEQIATYHAPLPVGQQKSIYERSLYFISFPFDVNASEIFGFGHYWDEWYLEYYDGLNRAKNGYWEDSPPNWKYVTPSMLNDFVLKANEGYILGLDLDFMKADNFDFWSNGISTVELFFPSTAAAGTLQQTNCTIPALGDEYRCKIDRGTTEGNRTIKDSYWRCLGVPSFNIYNTLLKDESGNPITWTADESALPFIYAWNKADNTLTAQSTSTFTFLPMHAYLVQNGGEIRWTNVSAKPASPIVARRVNEQPATEYEWRLALTSDSVLIDQTYVKMSNIEQVTDTFDFNQDMIKEFNAYRSDIYTYIGYERVAANSMPLQTEQTTVIPVGVKIKDAGDYTFAMPDGTNGVGVTLVDTQTGVRTNLGLMDYTVTLTAGSFNQRFVLEISPIMQTPTDIEEVTGDGLQVTGVRKVLIDQKMYIIRDGKVYDARGAKVK